MKILRIIIVSFLSLICIGNSHVLANKNIPISTMSSLDIDKAIQSATQNGQIIQVSSSGISVTSAVGAISTLPSVFRSSIDGYNYDIVVLEMHFKSDKAFLKVASKFEIPNSPTKSAIYFSNDNIAFSGMNGFKGDLTILPSSLDSRLNQELSPEILGILGSKTQFYEFAVPGTGNKLSMGLNEDSKMSFSCGTFETFKLSGIVKSYNAVAQEDDLGNEINKGMPLTFSFTNIKVNDWKDMYFETQFANSFHSSNYSDIGFGATKAIIDLSIRQNPAGLPPCAAGSGSYWKGVHIDKFKIRLPQFVKLKNGGAIPQFTGNNLYIDPSGLVGTINHENVVSLIDGTTGGKNPLDMSLEKLSILYSCDSKVAGFFEGEIGFEMCDESKENVLINYNFSFDDAIAYTYKFGLKSDKKLKNSNEISFENGSSILFNIESGVINVSKKYYATPSISSDVYNNSICKNSTVNLKASGCTDFIEWNNSSKINAIVASPIKDTVYSARCYDKYCISANSNSLEIKVYENLSKPILESNNENTKICSYETVLITNTGECPGIVEWSFDDGQTFKSLTNNALVYPLYVPTISTKTTYTIQTRCKLNDCYSSVSDKMEISIVPSSPKPTLQANNDEFKVCTDYKIVAIGCPGDQIKWTINGKYEAEYNNRTYVEIKDKGTYSFSAQCVNVSGCDSEPSDIKYIDFDRCHCLPDAPTLQANTDEFKVCTNYRIVALGCPSNQIKWTLNGIYEADYNNRSYIDVTEKGNYSFVAQCVNAAGCESYPSAIKYLDFDRCHCAPTPSSITYFSHTDKSIRENESFTFVAETCSSGSVHWYNGSGEIATGNRLIRSELAGQYSYAFKCINSDGCESGFSYTESFTVKGLCDDEFKPTVPIYHNASPSNLTTEEDIKIAMGCANDFSVYWYNADKEQLNIGNSYTISNIESIRDKDIYLYTRCKSTNGCFSDFKSDKFRINSKTPLPTTADWVSQNNYRCTDNVSYQEEKDTNPNSLSHNTSRWIKKGGTACDNCTSPAAPTVTSSSTTAPATLTASGCTGTVTWNNGTTGNSYSASIAGTYTATCTIGKCTSGNSNEIDIITINCNKSLAPISLTGRMISKISNAISLGWNYQECAPDFVKIEGSDDSNNWYEIDLIEGSNKFKIGISKVNMNYFDDGEQFWFRVRSSNNGTLSDPSNVFSITIPKVSNPIPDPPSIKTDKNTICGDLYAILTAEGCSNGTITWSGNLGTGYTKQTKIAGKYTATCSNSIGTSPKSNELEISSKPEKPNSTSKVATCNSLKFSASCPSGDVVIIRNRWNTPSKFDDVYYTNGVEFTSIPNFTGIYAACKIGACESDRAWIGEIDKIPTAPTPPIIKANYTTVGCTRKLVSLTATGCTNAETIKWSNEATGNTINVGTGTYSAICERTADCKSGISNILTITQPISFDVEFTVTERKGDEKYSINYKDCNGDPKVIFENAMSGKSTFTINLSEVTYTFGNIIWRPK